MMVLSSATTGRPPCSALRISGATFRYIPYHHDRRPWSLRDGIQRRDAENAEISAELMPRRRRGGMGWETLRSAIAAEARRKKSPSFARIGRLKPAPPKQSELRSDGPGRALSHNAPTKNQ